VKLINEFKLKLLIRRTIQRNKSPNDMPFLSLIMIATQYLKISQEMISKLLSLTLTRIPPAVPTAGNQFQLKTFLQSID
jgi:hypothetical protein